MTDDRQKQPQSMADALAQADGAEEQEDATVQISKTELAAIRSSASNPALAPDVLREINRRRDGGAVEDDDATQTFDRGSLNSLLQEHPSPPEQASTSTDEDFTPTKEVELSEAEAPGAADQIEEFDMFDDFDVFDDFDDVEDLGELSDADLHAVVFGDDEAASASEEPSTSAPESQSEEIELLDDEEFDALEELTDDDDDDLPELAPPTSVAEESPPEPPVSEPAHTAPPAALDYDEPIADFRSPVSRLLTSGALVGGVAMLAAGTLRLATSDILTVIHPALAGLMVAVGVLLLMGLLISFLQGRSH